MIGKNDSSLTRKLKGLFGVADLSHDADLAMLIASNGIEAWQNIVWDSRINNPKFDNFCGNITAPHLLYPETANLTGTAREMIKLGGWEHEVANLTTRMLNLVGYLKLVALSPCLQVGQTVGRCFGQSDPARYKQDDIRQTWRPWRY